MPNFQILNSSNVRRGMYLHLPKAVNGVNLYSKLNIYTFVKENLKCFVYQIVSTFRLILFHRNTSFFYLFHDYFVRPGS